MKLLRRIRRIWNKREWESALAAYWDAHTLEEQSIAYARMVKLGADGY